MTTVETTDPGAPARPPRRRRPVLVWASGLLAVVLGLVALVVVGGDDTGGSRQGLLGNPAPDPALATLDGDVVRLSDLAGRRVILNFFNDWCAPCEEEYPELVEFAQAHADDPSVVLVWVARDYTDTGIRNWYERREPPGLVLLDPAGEARSAFRTTGQPETYAIAPDGTVCRLAVGPVTTGPLEDMLASTGGPEGGCLA